MSQDKRHWGRKMVSEGSAVSDKLFEGMTWFSSATNKWMGGERLCATWMKFQRYEIKQLHRMRQFRKIPSSLKSMCPKSWVCGVIDD